MYTTQPIPALVVDTDKLIIKSVYYTLGLEQADPHTTVNRPSKPNLKSTTRLGTMVLTLRFNVYFIINVKN